MTNPRVALILVVISIIAIAPLAAEADCRSWFSEEIKGWQENAKEAGITVFSNRGKNYDQFIGIMEIDASREALVNLLHDPEKEIGIGECRKLLPRCERAYIVSSNCNRAEEISQNKGEIYHFREFKVPGKDLYVVLQQVLTEDKEKNMTELRIKSVSDICEKPDLKRMKEQEATWKIQNKGMTTCVFYKTYSDPDESPLLWYAVNSEIRRAVIDTLKNMKCLRTKDVDWRREHNCPPQ